VRRVDVEVTELKVNEPLSDETLTIKIPEGGKVWDWRFDPPAEYEFRKDRTEEEIRALAEEAKRKRDERLAPYQEMAAQIEKRVGQKAPELPQATWFNSAPLHVSNLRGKVILLNFWATWCGPCHNDIRTLVSLNKSSTSDPLVIGIHDANADIDVVKNSIAEKGIRYPVSIDVKPDAKEGVSLRSWYRIRGIPYTILIDKNGHVAGHGALDDMLEKATSIECNPEIY
jgi:thiol-disulfide isomerase/thioredoxin